MGASLLSKLTAGICIIEVFLTNVVADNNTQMTWFEARDFCDSVNSSLVDPFIDDLSTEGAFWTNRRMEKHSSWIYIEGCTNTSSLETNSDTGRQIASVWECDNLCNHSESFGIQNSTCFCLKANITDITQENMCRAPCKNCTDAFPIQCCTDLVTVFRKFHIPSIPGIPGSVGNGQCLTCVDKHYIPLLCSSNRKCICGNEVLSSPTVDWRQCFESCKEKEKGNFVLTKQDNICKRSTTTPPWLPVRKRHFDETTKLCYSCINSTLNCQYKKCDHNYTVLCRKNSTSNEVNNSSDSNSSLSVSMNWNSSYESCFPNDTENENGKARISIKGTFQKLSRWVQSLGCIDEVNHSFPLSSVRLTIPYPSITLCEDICNTSQHFIVKNTTCVCVEYPNVTDPAVNDLCTILCKDIPPLGLYCGGTSAFNVFKTYRETEIESKNSSHSCVLLNCAHGEFLSPLITVNCNDNYSSSGLCVNFNEKGSRINQTETWEFSANYCKERNESLPSSLSLCNTTGFRDQQQWSGLVRVGTPVSITDGSQPDPSSVLGFNCTRCENSTCRSISCSSNRSSLCQIKNVNNQKTTTLSTIHATNINHHMTPSENDKSQVKDEDSNHLQIIGPVCAAAVIIAISIVVFIMYRRRRLKSNTGTNAIQLRDHVQNECAVVKKPNREAAENPQSDENVEENQAESAYVDSKMDVYDHLGEKHKRKFVQQSDNIYNYSGPCDNQYGDLELPMSDDTYDHAKTANTDNSEYGSCFR